MIRRAALELLLLGACVAVVPACGRHENVVYVDSKTETGPSTDPQSPPPTAQCAAGRWSHAYGSQNVADLLFGLDVSSACQAVASIHMHDPPTTAEPAESGNSLLRVDAEGNASWLSGLSTLLHADASCASQGAAWTLEPGLTEPVTLPEGSHGWTLRRVGAYGEIEHEHTLGLGEYPELASTGDGDGLLVGAFGLPLVIAGAVLETDTSAGIYVTRLNASGHLHWALVLSGEQLSVVDVAGDRFGGATVLATFAGQASIAGRSIATSTPDVAQQFLFAVDRDGQVTRLEPLPANVTLTDVSVDVLGRLLVAGTVDGSASLAGATVQGSLDGAFVAIIERDGAMAWQQQLVGASDVQVDGDYDGHVFVAGERSQVMDLGGGPIADGQSFVAHFDADGVLVASRGLDAPIEMFRAAPGGGVIFGGQYAETIDAGSGPLTVPTGNLRDLYLASLPPEL